MRTTVQLEDILFQEAKEQAAKEGKTFKEILEEGLRLVLNQRRERKGVSGGNIKLPVSNCRGGVQPGIDLTDTSALEDILSSS